MGFVLFCKHGLTLSLIKNHFLLQEKYLSGFLVGDDDLCSFLPQASTRSHLQLVTGQELSSVNGSLLKIGLRSFKNGEHSDA